MYDPWWYYGETNWNSSGEMVIVEVQCMDCDRILQLDYEVDDPVCMECWLNHQNLKELIKERNNN